MQALRIINKDGETPTVEEISAANKVASTFKAAKIGTFNVTDPVDDIEVTYHAYKSMAFTRGGNSIYFGYGKAVDMRCLCRGLSFVRKDYDWFDFVSLIKPYRSTVAIADGTELASVSGEYNNGEAINAFGYDGYVNKWSGASYAAIFDYLYPGGSNEIVRKPNLLFTAPDDACFIEGNAPFYPGSYDEVVTPEWQAEWDAGQVEGLIREHARRKKCSDGQLTYLRNGFLSPEFEYFIKAYHPVSTLLRRDIPMEIVSSNYLLVSDVSVPVNTNANGVIRTRTYSGTIVLRYFDKDLVEHTETFTGTATLEDVAHTRSVSWPFVYEYSYIYTYENYPLLASGSSGRCQPGALIGIPYLTTLKLNISDAILHDNALSNYPLIEIANGITKKTVWKSDTQHNATPSYDSIYEAYVPPIQKSDDNLALAHPQFLLDYIAASKPIETEVNEAGNKVPVTPSTNWLSSRLSHDEVVTVVPLSFVNADGDDRGIYPYPQTSLNQEVTAQIKVVGFAKFKFNYFTSSFTFVNWTELTTEGDIKHDGNATYDDETNPTSVTVGETTYTLQPKYIDYDPEFGSTNCVCIGNKAIWTDVKADAKEQKLNIADTEPEGHTLTAEEKLYKAVREVIA